MSDEQNYVSMAAWVRQVGRPDLVDEVADQFERPAPAVRGPARWPQRSRGWRSVSRLHLHPAPERDAV